MRPLTIYHDYSREEVQSIFAPGTPADKESPWQAKDIVPVPGRPDDLVLFVSSDGEAPSITEDGVFTWKSPSSLTLESEQIVSLIKHDESSNSIYLFWRPRNRSAFTYLGRLKYLVHNKEKEKPVFIRWQILGWEIPQKVLERTGITLAPPADMKSTGTSLLKSRLKPGDMPCIPGRGGLDHESFESFISPDLSKVEKDDTELNLAGEMIVIAHERRSLIAQGRADLAHAVRHVSKIEGRGAPYDIESFTPDGEIRYIKVKCTRGPACAPFYLRSREVDFARQHSDDYLVYRVYNYEDACNSGNLFVIPAGMKDSIKISPVYYRVDLS